MKIGMAVVLISLASSAMAASPSYTQGMADRQGWETWFAGLTGDYREGALFWSGQRSLPNPGSCSPSGITVGEWTAGCIAAQQRLAPTDARRKTEPDYRLGWNEWTASGVASVSPGTAPVSIAEPQVLGGDAPITTAAPVTESHYTFDIPKLYPNVFLVWQKILSREITSEWLTKFEGTATPLQDVTVRSSPSTTEQMKFGTICKPHDCGDNVAGILFQPSGHIVAVAYMHGADGGQCNLLVVGEINRYEADFISDKLGKC